MNTRDLLIRCLAVREGTQWVGICLPYDLAAQAETFEELRVKMDEQIRHYLEDAMVGPDRVHGEYLLTRSAPARYWLKYWLVAAMELLRAHAENLRRFKTPVPLAPAAC
jgi:predicted RNase H-like HicB family nuclease